MRAISASVARQRTFEDELGERVEAVHLELVHHLDQPLRAGVVAGAQRVDVAFQFHRQARAGADEVEERLVRRGPGRSI